MSSKSLFWKCLDVRLGPIREPVWKLALGDEFPLVQRYLAPVPGLSPIASCERSRQTACNYRIVEHQDGSLVGICDEGRCPRRSFERAELIRYEPQDRRIMEEVGKILRLPFNPTPLGLPGASLFLGNLPGTASAPVQILFTRQSNPQDFKTFVERQILADRFPFILLSPTLRHLTPDVAALLQRKGCRPLALDGGFELGPRGLAATDSFLAAWRELCASFAPAESLSDFNAVEEPPPEYALTCEGATWRMNFLGHHGTIPDMRGMQYLARLLNQPDLSFSPIDLQEDLDPAEPVTASLEGLAASAEGDGGIAATDRSAQLAYARKVAELKAAADDARDAGREMEADEIEAELDEIRAHLRKVTGKGRLRVDSRHERARKAVTKALNVALAALESRCAPAAKYISPRVRKGNEFTYTPALGEVWRVKFFQKK